MDFLSAVVRILLEWSRSPFNPCILFRNLQVFQEYFEMGLTRISGFS